MSDTKKTPITKTIAGILRAVAGAPHPKNFTSAVICAAGSSTRMEKLMGEPRKQFIELNGIPVVARTLMAYEAANTVPQVVECEKSLTATCCALILGLYEGTGHFDTVGELIVDELL